MEYVRHLIRRGIPWRLAGSVLKEAWESDAVDLSESGQALLAQLETARLALVEQAAAAERAHMRASGSPPGGPHGVLPR